MMINQTHRIVPHCIIWCLLVLSALILARTATAAEPIAQPGIVGDWWQVAGDPDLGALTTPGQQPVDFGIWQAADGTWQLCSCIRGTKEAGHTRLFYRWEGAKLTDADWKPMGIAMHADPRFGEMPGGLQAPYVFQADGRFVMFYGGWEDICSATSADGKQFERRRNSDGKAALFRSHEGTQTRDPMVLRIGELWYCYYTAHSSAATRDAGADYCRTSKDLLSWSEPYTVAKGGRAGSGAFSAECPFVVELHPGAFYLFRTQRYGRNCANQRLLFARSARLRRRSRRGTFRLHPARGRSGAVPARWPVVHRRVAPEPQRHPHLAAPLEVGRWTHRPNSRARSNETHDDQDS